MRSYSSKERKALRWAQSCRQYKLGVRRKGSVVSPGEDSSSRELDQRASSEKLTVKRQRAGINSRFHVLHMPTI